MQVVLYDNEEKRDHILDGVEQIINIRANYTQHEELKNTILIIHKINHVEKFRLYRNATILEIKDK